MAPNNDLPGDGRANALASGVASDRDGPSSGNSSPTSSLSNDVIGGHGLATSASHPRDRKHHHHHQLKHQHRRHGQPQQPGSERQNDDGQWQPGNGQAGREQQQQEAQQSLADQTLSPTSEIDDSTFGRASHRRKPKKLIKNPSLYWEWDNGAAEHHHRVKINTDDVSFPPGFLWGVATAAHQIEGNSTNNNWHAWEQLGVHNGKHTIRGGQVSGIACDHWNRVDSDVELVKELGCNAYRMSIEWSKIEISDDEWNLEAIEHYKYELRALLAKGIVPFVTLHHFTHPIWFDKLGAFEKTENIKYFVRFAKRAFHEFGAMVKHWCTINEPEVYVTQGFFAGIFPPGKQDWNLAGNVLKNLLEAHVQVYYAIKDLPGGAETQIGIVKNIFQFEPLRSWHPLDVYISSVLQGAFNQSIISFFKTGIFNFRLLHVSVSHSNSRAIRSNDFIGLNYYSHYHVKFQLNSAEPFLLTHDPSAGTIMTDMPYPMYPEGFYRALKYLHAELKLPIYVTENGLADAKDDRRSLFLRRYLYALSRAIKEGVDCRGYFYWTLYDNFEWTEHFTMRFGLYELDMKTQKRTLRDGSKYYQHIIKRFTERGTITN